MNRIFILIITLFVFGCEKPNENFISNEQNAPLVEVDDRDLEEFCATGSLCSDHIWNENGKTWLWGGYRENMHFEITSWQLNGENLRSGLGRETIVSLVNPQFIPKTDLTFEVSDNQQAIILYENPIPKVFTLDALKQHEVVNTMFGNEAIMVTYCQLADYASVLKRNYCNKDLTFAASGYTFSEQFIYEGKQGFVLWDRDTESLWWPLTNKGVSGTMLNQTMQNLNSNFWGIKTISEIESIFGENYIMLKPYQDLEISSELAHLIALGGNCE